MGAILLAIPVSARNYTLDEVSELRFTDPYAALPRLDSLQKIGQAEGWKQFSQTKLEAITSLTYHYLDEWFDSVKHSMKAVEAAQETPSDRYYKIVAYRILAYYQVRSGNWNEMEKMIPDLEKTIADRPGLKMNLQKCPRLYKLEIAAVRDGQNDAIDTLKMMVDSLQTNLDSKNHGYYLETVRALANVYGKMGRNEDEKEMLKQSVEVVEGFRGKENETLEQSRASLTEMRLLARLATLCIQGGEEDVEVYVRKALEISSSYRSSPGITRVYNELIDALANTVVSKDLTITHQSSMLKAKRARRHLTEGLAAALLALVLLMTLLFFREKKNNRMLYRSIEEMRRNTKFYNSVITKEGVGDDIDPEGLLTRLHDHFCEDNRFLDQDLDIDAELKKIGTNRRAVNAMLKESLDGNIGDYLRNLKLEVALEKLRSTNDTIDAIADDCGFNSTRTFLRGFKEKFNLTPTQYRKLSKES